MNRSVVDRIPEGRPVSVERETFPEMAEARTLYAMQSNTYWLDTGTPEQFLEANLDVLQGRRKNKPAMPRTSIHATAKVEDSVIGTASRVDAEATVKHSVLFSDSHICRGATVINSVLADEV